MGNTLGVDEKVMHWMETQTGLARVIAARLEELDSRLPGGRRAVAGPWRDEAEYLGAVRNAGERTDRDVRLKVNAVTTWGGEQVPSAGGFALPAQFYDEVLAPVTGPQSLLSIFQPTPTTSDILRVAVDEESDFGTAGVTAALLAEGEAITPTKPVLHQVSAPMYRVASLVHGSSELGRNAPAMPRHILRSLSRKAKNKTEAFIVAGTGENQPLGLLNGPAVVTVPKGDSTASAFGNGDIGAMVARLVPGAFGASYWICHSSCLPSIMNLGPTYNANGPSVFGYGTLLGRPLAVSEHANVMGTKGDLILCAPEGFLYGLDGAYGVATSDFAFDQDLQSFRLTLYMGGAPLLSTPVPRRTGSDTLSHVVVLAAR